MTALIVKGSREGTTRWRWCLQIAEAGEASVGTEAAASEAVGAASAEETVVDLEEATKWEEGGSLLDLRVSVTTRGRHQPRAGFHD